MVPLRNPSVFYGRPQGMAILPGRIDPKYTGTTDIKRNYPSSPDGIHPGSEGGLEETPMLLSQFIGVRPRDSGVLLCRHTLFDESGVM
jgi:hypothetical protein